MTAVHHDDIALGIEAAPPKLTGGALKKLFSTNSAIALSGLLCESAMIRIAFQSSPMRGLPLSLLLDFIHDNV
jgi:hypothetical protein